MEWQKRHKKAAQPLSGFLGFPFSYPAKVAVHLISISASFMLFPSTIPLNPIKSENCYF